MERARLHRGNPEVRQPGPHLGRRPRGERHREHVARLDLTRMDAVRDAMGDRTGLPRARSGQDAEGSGIAHNGRPLCGAQAVEKELAASVQTAGVRP